VKLDPPNLTFVLVYHSVLHLGLWGVFFIWNSI